MIKFFRKLFSRIFKREKNLILTEILAANQGILRELTAMRGEATSREVVVQKYVSEMNEELVKLTKMIYDMVQSLSKYFKLEVEFMEKEKEKTAKKPTEHDAIF